MKFKPLAEQVIVITGATSGIGLVTARPTAEIALFAGAGVAALALFKRAQLKEDD